MRAARERPGVHTDPMSSTIVFLHAHPDDEAIFTGGTMARLAAAGVRVVLVVATAGELGATPDAGEHDRLPEHRRAETDAAAAELGIARVAFLGYRDSGLPGDPANDAPGSFFSADTEAVALEVAALLVEEAASAVVVYDAGGIYGHPDHVQVHRVGVRAAALAGVETVYQATVDREYLHFVETHLVDHAGDAIPGPLTIGVPSVLVTTMVDVRTSLAAKRRAIAAHASQVPETSTAMTMPAATFADVYGYEWFVRTGPPGCIDDL
jgi:LmbE family N-acetylglucosaminyl deacetylase